MHCQKRVPFKKCSLENPVPLEQGWGTYLLSWAAWILHYHWRAVKSINFIPKFYLYLTIRKYVCSWLTIQVPAYHRASFLRDAVALIYVTKILMRAISNVQASRIWPPGRRFFTPALEYVLTNAAYRRSFTVDKIAGIFAKCIWQP